MEEQEERLDKILMQLNLVTTRVRAERIIQEDGVLVNGKLINKPGKKFPIDVTIEMLTVEIPWVSRGALKLVHAIENWKVDFSNLTILDIGASTGGFTEVCLQNGAVKVYSVDVGTNQLHPRIASDERVKNLQRTHVRELTPTLIDRQIDACVIDVSFISLTKIFPFIHSLLKQNAFVVALVKPQFEVGKEHIGKGGIVKNQALYAPLIETIKEEAAKNNLKYEAHIESPILGGDGNREFLMLLRKV